MTDVIERSTRSNLDSPSTSDDRRSESRRSTRSDTWARSRIPRSAAPVEGAAPVLVTDLASKTLAVKEGDTFLYSDLEGNLDHGGDYGLGLYSKDTRFLSVFRMTINGRDPVLLSSSSERGYMSHVDLTNPDLFDGDAPVRSAADAEHPARSARSAAACSSGSA